MVRDFERKLRLTAAALGAMTLKDLARAFRRANPATGFSPERAAKWLQGRAHPREQTIYEDWATVLGLKRPVAWLCGCELESFLEALSARHDVAPGILRARAEAFGRARSVTSRARHHPLCGAFASYRHAFSPYFRGRVLRGALTVEPAANGGELVGHYAEALPTGPVRLSGPVAQNGRTLFIDLAAVTDEGYHLRAFFSLFAPTPPASLLVGLHCGATLIGTVPEPSCSRLLLVRVPTTAAAAVERSNRYLEPAESLACDLAALGLAVPDPAAELDDRLDTMLRGGSGGGLDQIEAAAYTALASVVDRIWLDTLAAGAARIPLEAN